MFTNHSIDRMNDTTRNIPSWMAAKASKVSGMYKSAALVLGEVEFRNKGQYDLSNGQTVVAIVRDGRVVTMMLRRASQPMTPDALRVSQVVEI